MNSAVIKKLKIIEFASVLAGPLVGTFFAEMGARVIKIENPKTDGDITRSWKTESENEESGISAYYASANHGKESIFLDLTIEKDKNIAVDLCRDADIVISNFKSASAENLGFDWKALRKINPSLIYAELSGFPGDTNIPAFDVLLQAQTGYISMTGFPERKYAKIPVAMIDIIASHQLREGILVAILERAIDGKGRKVSTNLYASALSALVNQASAYLMNGDIAQPLGSQHPQIAPYGDLFNTKDGIPLILAIGTDRKFHRLLQILDAESMWKEYNTNQKRVRHRDQLCRILSEKIKKQNSNDLIQMLDSEGIPYSKINNLKNVFDQTESSPYLIRQLKEGRECIKTKTVVFNIEVNT